MWGLEVCGNEIEKKIWSSYQDVPRSWNGYSKDSTTMDRDFRCIKNWITPVEWPCIPFDTYGYEFWNFIAFYLNDFFLIFPFFCSSTRETLPLYHYFRCKKKNIYTHIHDFHFNLLQTKTKRYVFVTLYLAPSSPTCNGVPSMEIFEFLKNPINFGAKNFVLISEIVCRLSLGKHKRSDFKHLEWKLQKSGIHFPISLNLYYS